MTRAVLEGVAFAFADGQAALEAAGTEIGVMSVIGGGARSQFWGEILASALGKPLTYHKGGEGGAGLWCGEAWPACGQRGRSCRNLHPASGGCRGRAPFMHCTTSTRRNGLGIGNSIAF